MAKELLLVDDDVDYTEGMKIQLEAAGYDVRVAHSVSEGKIEIEKKRPDACVVDLMMDEPDDGFALCYWIKKNDAELPVIMVTAVTSETGLDFGASTTEEKSWIKADAMLAKPVRIDQLERELKRFFH